MIKYNKIIKNIIKETRTNGNARKRPNKNEYSNMDKRPKLTEKEKNKREIEQSSS